MPDARMGGTAPPSPPKRWAEESLDLVKQGSAGEREATLGKACDQEARATGGNAARQEISAKYQALARLGAHVVLLEQARRQAQRRGCRRSNHPLPISRYDERPEGGSISQWDALGIRGPDCQEGPPRLFPMYCHESNGVIKTEWPAVLLRSNVGLLSLLQQLASRVAIKRFVRDFSPARLVTSLRWFLSAFAQTCAGTSLGLGTPTSSSHLDSRRSWFRVGPRACLACPDVEARFCSAPRPRDHNKPHPTVFIFPRDLRSRKRLNHRSPNHSTTVPNKQTTVHHVGRFAHCRTGSDAGDGR